MNRKFLFALTFIFTVFNCIFASAEETGGFLGLREYEESRGNTVYWDEDNKKISVYSGNDFMYLVRLGSGSIDLGNLRVHLDYRVGEENGKAYLEKETIDFINGLLFPTKDFPEENGYSLTQQVYENGDKSKVINYPKIENYKGELLQQYMNQDILGLVNGYAENNMYKSISMDYSIEKSDDKYISILFSGTAEIEGFNNKMNIMDSITFDLDTGNRISAENYIKDSEGFKIILENNAAKPLEYESLRFYFKGDDVVFYYRPLDDSSNFYDIININRGVMLDVANDSFGEKPAS